MTLIISIFAVLTAVVVPPVGIPLTILLIIWAIVNLLGGLFIC